MDIDNTSEPGAEPPEEADDTADVAVGYESDVQALDGADKFCNDIFKEAEPPLLPRPASPPRCGGRGRRVIASTRSSMRLAARPSPVPVSQRAQQKLMKELQFLDSPTLAPDATITDYVDIFGQDLPAQAICAIQTAARMNNKKLSKVLSGMVESGAAAMEVP